MPQGPFPCLHPSVLINGGYGFTPASRRPIADERPTTRRSWKPSTPHFNPDKVIIWFPSYDYLDAIAECWQKAYPDAEGLLIRQKPVMSLKEREAFLAEFSHPDEKTKLGFALLGGIFGEGIDLVGAQLIGVMVVGVGLPQICLERDLIRDHFEHTEGCGFEFAYTFPGLNRVLQGLDD